MRRALGLAPPYPGWARRTLVQTGGGAYLFQLRSPYFLHGLCLQLVGGGTWTCPQHGLISVQGGLEENQDPEDLGNSPKESSLESATRGSKEPSAQPAAISFLGALRIPVRSLWGEARERLSRFLCWMPEDGGGGSGWSMASRISL